VTKLPYQTSIPRGGLPRVFLKLDLQPPHEQIRTA
jgi:hypothetical protein